MSDELLNHQLGSYRLVQRLGRGAFGSVYLGKHFLLEHKPPVAVKVLNTTLTSQEELDRFFQEALILDKLTHPNILQVLDANIYEGYPFFVAELASNGSLQDRLEDADGYAFPLTEAIRILTQVGLALQYAHDLDIIHRDLKPANILFNAQDDALLADFGISVQLHKTGRVDKVGTPIYMAPEQFKGLISKKSDQYSLACVAYELLTGRLLFTADDPYEIGYKHIYEPPLELRAINPTIPDEIEQVVLKALSKDRDDRYPNIEDFVVALRVAAGLSTEMQAETPEIYTVNQGIDVVPNPPTAHTTGAQGQHTPHLNISFDGQYSRDLPSQPMPQSVPSPATGPRSERAVSSSGAQRASVRLTHLWSRATDLDHTYFAEPTISDGLIYVGTYTTTEHHTEGHFQVQCLDGATGQLLWAFKVEQGVWSAPAVADGIVFVCTSQRDAHGKIYALDARTGEKIWALGTKEALLASPQVLDGTVYIYSQHALYVLDAENGQRRWAVAVDEEVFAPPTLLDGVVYVSTKTGKCYGLDMVTGHHRSAFSDVGNIYAVGQAQDGVICVGLYNDGLYGDEVAGGKTLWYSMIDKQLSGAGLTIAQQTIYVASHGGYSDSARERLFSININTGQQNWVATLRSIAVAPPVISNEVVYVSTFSGEIHAIDAKQGKLLTSMSVGSRKPTRPAVADGLVAVCIGDLHAYRLS